MKHEQKRHINSVEPSIHDNDMWVVTLNGNPVSEYPTAKMAQKVARAMRKDCRSLEKHNMFFKFK